MATAQRHGWFERQGWLETHMDGVERHGWLEALRTDFLLGVDQSAVEAAAKLDEQACRLCGIPSVVELLRAQAERALHVHRVVRAALCHHCRPLLAKRRLELVSRYVEVLWLKDGGFARDRVVMLVDEALFVNHLARDLALARHSDADLAELLLDERLHRRSVGMRLGKDEGALLGTCQLGNHIAHCRGEAARPIRTVHRYDASLVAHV